MTHVAGNSIEGPYFHTAQAELMLRFRLKQPVAAVRNVEHRHSGNVGIGQLAGLAAAYPPGSIERPPANGFGTRR